MTVTETRAELSKVIDILPQDCLVKFLDHAKQLQQKQKELRRDALFEITFKEDAKLLKRLANS